VEKSLYHYGKKRKPLIAVLVKRTVSFFFVMCIFSVFLYGIGTAQGFMDRTLLFLLRLSVLLGFFQGVGSLYGFILDFWLLFHRREFRYLYGAGAYLFLCFLGAGIAVSGVFIIIVAGGNAA
jgi:hypothetical protein